jgi:hypothetical protein
VRWNDAAFGALVAAFPNTGFMGVPLLVALLGAAAAGPAILTILVDLVITTSLCIALSRLDGADEHGAAKAAKSALKGVAANPMPWAIMAGAVASWLQLEPIKPVMQTIGLLADAASPVALFTIGAVLARSQIVAAREAHGPMPVRDYLPVVVAKLVAHPLLVWGAGTAAIRPGRAAGPVCADRDGAGGRAAQRQQCVVAGRALWGRQRADCPHHPADHGGGVPDVLRRRRAAALGRDGLGLAFTQANAVQRRGQLGHGAVHVVPLLQAEQADAEGLEVRALVALQRHAGSGLQALGQEFLAGLDSGSVV